jgi:phosphatidate cytidylyltransferase
VDQDRYPTSGNDPTDERPGDEQTPSVRIDAPEAGVVAGITSPTPIVAPLEKSAPLADAGEPTAAYEMPDWADPPTGQVPRVLLDDPDAPEHAEPIVRGPSWREDASDWSDEIDLSILAPSEDEVAQIAGSVEPSAESPFDFAFDEVDETLSEEEERAWQPVLEHAPSPTRRRHARSRTHRRSRPDTAQAVPRNALVATTTGVALAALCVVGFLLGAPATLALVTVVLTIAASEAFAALQRAGYRPATLIGVLTVPALSVGAYLDGPRAIPVVIAASALASALWFVLKAKTTEVIADASATVLVIAWVGVLGSFAGLVLAPSIFPRRHGIAIILSVIVLTALYDIGAYAIGSWRGRHKLAPLISPGKTIEGAIGGSLLCLIAAVLVVAHIHPFNFAHALELGGVVLVLAPLGDLFESLVKRDLEIKDMGTLLPAHGGVLDRIDAMLFVMAPAYCLMRLVHI